MGKVTLMIFVLYIMVRMVQVPLEMTANKEEWMGLPFKTRFFIVAGVSALGLFVVAILTLVALVSKGF